MMKHYIPEIIIFYACCLTVLLFVLQTLQHSDCYFDSSRIWVAIDCYFLNCDRTESEDEEDGSDVEEVRSEINEDVDEEEDSERIDVKVETNGAGIGYCLGNYVIAFLSYCFCY